MTYLGIVDVGIAKLTERVKIFKVSENLEVRDWCIDGITVVLEVFKGVGDRATVAKIDIEAEGRVSHFAQFSRRLFDALSCHVSSPNAEAFLINVHSTRRVCFSNQEG